MANDLVSPDDLLDFPGAPFPESVVDSVVDAIRIQAGWHIAPSRRETLLRDCDGGRTLFLPTLHLTEVHEVADVTNPENPKAITGWRKSRSGMVSGPWFPYGDETVELDITHGFEEVPPALLMLVAELAQLGGRQTGVRQETAGGESVSYSVGEAITPQTQAILSRFSLPDGFR